MNPDPTTVPANQVRPVYADPKDHWDYDEDENPTDHSVGWALSFGCQLTIGYEDDVLTVTVSTSDRDKQAGITKRTVTPEAVTQYAHQLLALVAPVGAVPGTLAATTTDATTEWAVRQKGTVEPIPFCDEETARYMADAMRHPLMTEVVCRTVTDWHSPDAALSPAPGPGAAATDRLVKHALVTEAGAMASIAKVVGLPEDTDAEAIVYAVRKLAETALAPGNEPDGWRPMDEAPMDGTEIDGWYGPDEIVRIRWAEERRCMLAGVAPGAGLFGPGWECVAESLIVEDPLKWRAASAAQEGGDRG